MPNITLVSEIEHADAFAAEGRRMARRCRGWLKDIGKEWQREEALFGNVSASLREQRRDVEREASRYDRQHRFFRQRLRKLTAQALAAAVAVGILAGTAQAASDTPICGPVYAERPMWSDHHMRDLVGIACYGDGVTPVRYFQFAPAPTGKVRG